jgi:hypothetical protein
MTKRSPTLLEYAIGKAGVLRGARVCAFVTQWTLAQQAIGHHITIEEYRDWWNESTRTAYRHQSEFRAVFGMPTPQAIADHAIARAEALQHGVKGVGALPAELVLA